MHFLTSQGSHTWIIVIFMQGVCHYAEVLKRNLVDKQPHVQEASQKEPVKSKSSYPLQHTKNERKNKVSYNLNMSINIRSLKKKIMATLKKIPYWPFHHWVRTSEDNTRGTGEQVTLSSRIPARFIFAGPDFFRSPHWQAKEYSIVVRKCQRFTIWIWFRSWWMFWACVFYKIAMFSTKIVFASLLPCEI